MTRATTKGMNGYLLWSRRMLVLFCMGNIHGHFQGGEVLGEYAILGMFLMLFYKMKKSIILIIGIVTLALASFSTLEAKSLLTLPLMLVGLAAGQYCVFEKISEHRKKIVIFTSTMLILSVVGVVYHYTQVPSSPIPSMIVVENTEQENKFINLGIIIEPIISSFYIGGIILLLRFKCMQTLLLPLKLYGRMALTNYLGQTFLILISGYTFHLFKNITYIQSFCLCIFIYIVQIIFSVIWMRFFVMGPLEWLWRLITYWKVPQIRKN